MAGVLYAHAYVEAWQPRAMMTDPAEPPIAANDETGARPLTEAAKRALAEAAERRASAEAWALDPEHGGPRGPEPTRYGDWEKKGLAIDF